MEKPGVVLFVAELRELNCPDMAALAASDMPYLVELGEKGRVELWGPGPESLDELLR